MRRIRAVSGQISLWDVGEDSQTVVAGEPESTAELAPGEPTQTEASPDAILVDPSTPPAITHVIPRPLVKKPKRTGPPRPKPVLVTPSVTFHKKGRYLKIKANDVLAADVLRELDERRDTVYMDQARYYGESLAEVELSHDAKVPLYQILHQPLGEYPLAKVLETYGVYVYISPTLANYLRKEGRRAAREQAPFPFPQADASVSLFDRCCEGTILRCIKPFRPHGANADIFKLNERYLVVDVGQDGDDSIFICTEAISANKQLDAVSTGKRHKWTLFSEDMEIYFSDSEYTDIGATILDQFPVPVTQKQKNLSGLGLPLWKHVEVDAAMMALKRGTINAYPMRMAKTSSAISVTELFGSQKVFVIGPRNARLFTVNEFKRLGFVEDQDFVTVNKLADLDKPAKYYLITNSWIKQGPGADPTAKLRNEHTNPLRPVSHIERRRIELKEGESAVTQSGQKKKEFVNIEVKHVNRCPHCQENLVRPLLRKEAYGAETSVYWTREKGYMCRNPECSWRTDNRVDPRPLGARVLHKGQSRRGAAWGKGKRQIHHKGGYIDWTLLAHAQCPPHERLKGRYCPSCRQADGTWKPGLYRRLMKRPTLVIKDEIHDIKDRTTDLAKAVYSLKPRRRLGLTGTLVSNSPLDAYWPMHWACNAPSARFPYAFGGGAKQFEMRFCSHVSLEKPMGTQLNLETGEEEQITKTVRKRIPFVKNPPDLWRFFADKIIRRTYDDPLFQQTLLENDRQMPKIVPIEVPCVMNYKQAEIMLESIKDFRKQYEKMLEAAQQKNQEVNTALVISQMSTLKIVATCPEMLNDRFKAQVYSGPAGGGKIFQIERLVEQKTKEGGKVLVLSDFHAMQKTVAKHLHKYNPILFNTSWDDEARREAFEAFQFNEHNRVFVAGTRAIREGVDLSAADTCICSDLLWSPAFQVQAWSRIAAPQKRERTCNVYLMLSKNSIDEHIFTTFYAKMVAAAQALDRRVVERRAQRFNVQWFVDRVLEEENAIATNLRESEPAAVLTPGLDINELQEREV